MGYTLYLCGRFSAPGAEPDALTRRVEQALARRFGSRALVGGATPTAQALFAADMALALIDAQWTQAVAREPNGLTPTTLVAAAQENKVILPLLLGEAPMPAAEDLPPHLRFLHYRNALTVRDGASFDGDMATVCEQIETTLRGRSLGVQAGVLAALTGGWLSLLLAVSLVFVGVLLTHPSAAAVASAGWLALLGRFLSDAQRASLIAFTPLVLVSLYIALRLALWRRWRPAALLALCAAVMAFELTQRASNVGLLSIWSHVAWVVALVTTTPPLIPAAAVALLTLFTLAARPSRLTYSNRALMSAYRTQQAAAMSARDITPGLYIACRREDISATYQALCASLERNFTRFASFARPIYRSYSAPDAPHCAEWGTLLEQSPDVMVVMGPHWLAGGADDPLRQELAVALREGKTLIPVLLDGASAPTPAETPPELAPLCFMQPIRIAGRRDYHRGFDEAFSRVLDVPNGYRDLFAWLLDSVFFNYSPSVFISYRRADSALMCDRIYGALRRRSQLGRGVFRDTDAISAGVDFFAVLMNAIASSKVVIALIGPQWLSLTDAAGARRLDDPDDMVRKELALALDQGKTVLPVLLDGARMPSAAELPADLAPLAALAPMTVNGGPRFARDAARLGWGARRRLGEQRHPLLALASVVGLALWLGVLLIYLTHQAALVAYLLEFAPQWRFSAGSLLTFTAQPPDVGLTGLLVTLALAASSATVTLSLTAALQMARRRQWWLLTALALVVVWLGAQLLGIAMVWRGFVPAWYTVASAGGQVSLLFTPILLARLAVLAAALLCAGLALYFWRSRSEPRAMPA